MPYYSHRFEVEKFDSAALVISIEDLSCTAFNIVVSFNDDRQEGTKHADALKNYYVSQK